MTKDELKAKIENAAAAIENGESEINFDATAAIYGGKVPYAATKDEFADTDFEDTYEGDDGEEYTKMAAIIAKNENGEVTVYVENGECYPPIYGVEEFANVYGE